MTQSSDQHVIWLTQEAFDKLQQELEHLRGPLRTEIIEKISAARDEGDLKENGGYHAAREEQGKAEARIRQLEDMLRRAEVEDTTDGLQVFSPQSPLGAAIIGAKKGETITYEAPNGKELKVEIVDAVPFTG